MQVPSPREPISKVAKARGQSVAGTEKRNCPRPGGGDVMTNAERDDLLLDLRKILNDHGERLERIEGKIDGVSDQLQDVALV